MTTCFSLLNLLLFNLCLLCFFKSRPRTSLVSYDRVTQSAKKHSVMNCSLIWLKDSYWMKVELDFTAEVWIDYARGGKRR